MKFIEMTLKYLYNDNDDDHYDDDADGRMKMAMEMAVMIETLLLVNKGTSDFVFIWSGYIHHSA